MTDCLKFFRPKEVFVFMIGGVTFQEAAIVGEFNNSNLKNKVILAGDFIHNSKSFLLGF